MVVVFTQLQNVRVKHNLSLLLNFLGPGAQSRIMEKKLHLHGVRLFHLCFFFFYFGCLNLDEIRKLEPGNGDLKSELKLGNCS